MAREKSHDPGVNLYSDGDSDGELNNTKFSPGASPSAKDVESVFVYNDLRKGGPQGNGGSKDSTNAGNPPEAVATLTTTQPVTQAAAQTTTTQTTTTQAAAVQTTTTTQAAAETPSPPPSPCRSIYRASNCEENPKVKYNGDRSNCNEDDNHRFCKKCAEQNRCPRCGKEVPVMNKSKPPVKCRRQ